MSSSVERKRNRIKEIKLTKDRKSVFMQRKEDATQECRSKDPIELEGSKLSVNQIEQPDESNENETSQNRSKESVVSMDNKLDVSSNNIQCTNPEQIPEKEIFHPKEHKEKENLGNNFGITESTHTKCVTSGIYKNRGVDTLILDKNKLGVSDELYGDIYCGWEQKYSNPMAPIKSDEFSCNCSCNGSHFYKHMFCNYIMCKLPLMDDDYLYQKKNTCDASEIVSKSSSKRNKFNICCCNYKNINKDISNIENNFKCCQEYKKDIDLLLESHLEGNCKRKHKDRLDYLCEIAYFEYFKNRYGKCCKINKRILKRIISQQKVSLFDSQEEKCCRICIFGFCWDTYCSGCNICLYSKKQGDRRCKKAYVDESMLDRLEHPKENEGVMNTKNKANRKNDKVKY